MRIAYNDFVAPLLSGAIVGSTVNASFPEINTADQRLATVYRSTAVTAQTVTIDLGSAQGIAVAAIIAHNFTSSATVVIAGNNSNSWGSPAFTASMSLNNAVGMIILYLGSVQTYEFWQFQISDPTNPAGYLQIGRLWLSNYVQVSPSSLLDFTVTKKRTDRVVHGRGQQKFASLGSGWKYITLNFPASNYSMVDSMSQLHDAVGLHDSFIFCNFDTLRTYPLVDPLYCSFDGDLVFTADTDAFRFSYTVNIQEER
jgi:hypothetical protein